MNPTDTIIALEKALEAIESFRDGKPSPPDFDLSAALQSLSAQCTPRALRTLLDAHASALQALEWIVGNPGAHPANFVSVARAALDDNTKGASHGKAD